MVFLAVYRDFLDIEAGLLQLFHCGFGVCVRAINDDNRILI
jgi:hypothetical protein